MRGRHRPPTRKIDGETERDPLLELVMRYARAWLTMPIRELDRAIEGSSRGAAIAE